MSRLLMRIAEERLVVKLEKDWMIRDGS